MQNYREASRPHHQAPRDVVVPRLGLRQVLGVIVAAVLVAILLSLFSLIGARMDPGGGDCVLTDNAGCVETALAGKTAAGAEPGRGG